MTLPKDKRPDRWFPDLDLSLKQIEGMFEYGTSLTYSTPFGILKVTPEPKHCAKFEDRRNSDTYDRFPHKGVSAPSGGGKCPVASTETPLGDLR